MDIFSFPLRIVIINICDGGHFMVQKFNFKGKRIQLLTVNGLICYYSSMTEDEKRRITLAMMEISRQRKDGEVEKITK